MTEFWQNITLDLAFLALLGMLYYLWQRKRILRFEANKKPYLYSQILQLLLNEKRDDNSQPELDELIIYLDDFINETHQTDPRIKIETFLQSSESHPELNQNIKEILSQMPL